MNRSRNLGLFRWVIGVWPLLLCVNSPVQAQSPTLENPVAYTLLTSSNTGTTIPLARIILGGDSAQCPDLTSGSTSIATSARQNPDPGLFAVTVCEAVIPFGQSFTVKGTATTINAVTQSPSRILVYGDTGCKTSDCGTPSPTNPNPATPFQGLASAGAGQTPHLILHMGDYNYRGTPGTIHFKESGKKTKKLAVYDAGDDAPSDRQCQLTSHYYSQNATDSPSKDNWTNWSADFFLPAQDLLPLAPWVFARGNHELCSRAGPGWFYFLGPGSNLSGAGTPQQMTCPAQGSLASPDVTVLGHLAFVDPYAVNLNNLSVIVMDSANACDAFAPKLTTAKYSGQFKKLGGLSKGSSRRWFMTHRPLWGIKKYEPKKNPPVKVINQTLQSAFGNTAPANVSLLLSGHMHIFEALTFTAGTPPQLIVGNGGVELATEKHLPATIPQVSLTKNGPTVSSGTVIKQHGYMAIDLSSSGEGWTGILCGTGGEKLATFGAGSSPVCATNSTSE